MSVVVAVFLFVLFVVLLVDILGISRSNGDRVLFEPLGYRLWGQVTTCFRRTIEITSEFVRGNGSLYGFLVLTIFVIGFLEIGPSLDSNLSFSVF